MRIKDITLREGEQAPPIAFADREKARLAGALADAGVAAIQVGFAGRHDADVSIVRDAVGSATTIEVLVPGWDPSAPDSMHSAFVAGADMCGVLMRSTDKALAATGLTRQEAIVALHEAIAAANEIGYREVRIGLSYASEADPQFRDELYTAGIDAGATVIGYADTPGTATPTAVAAAIGELRAAFPATGIVAHMHDDFGLAVANTVAAVEAGADWVDASVNGLGERAGNCALEEIAVALELLYGIRTGLDLGKLYDLSLLVEQLSGDPIPRMKPIVGEDCFSNKLDLHVEAALKGTGLFEPFDPATVGRARSIKLGSGSGPAAIRAVAAQHGISLDDDAVPALVRAVNEIALRQKRCVSVDELRDAARELAG